MISGSIHLSQDKFHCILSLFMYIVQQSIGPWSPLTEMFTVLQSDTVEPVLNNIFISLCLPAINCGQKEQDMVCSLLAGIYTGTLAPLF